MIIFWEKKKNNKTFLEVRPTFFFSHLPFTVDLVPFYKEDAYLLQNWILLWLISQGYSLYMYNNACNLKCCILVNAEMFRMLGEVELLKFYFMTSSYPSLDDHERKHCSSVYIAWKVMSDFVTPWAVIHRVPLPMRFSKQEYCSG